MQTGLQLLSCYVHRPPMMDEVLSQEVSVFRTQPRVGRVKLEGGMVGHEEERTLSSKQRVEARRAGPPVVVHSKGAHEEADLRERGDHRIAIDVRNRLRKDLVNGFQHLSLDVEP